jgi:hypothetical protein
MYNEIFKKIDIIILFIYTYMLIYVLLNFNFIKKKIK